MGFQGEQGVPGIAGKTGVPVSDQQLMYTLARLSLLSNRAFALLVLG